MSNKPVTSEESAKLRDLHKRGVLTTEELRLAEAKLLEDSGDLSEPSGKAWLPWMLLAFVVAAGGIAFAIFMIVVAISLSNPM